MWSVRSTLREVYRAISNRMEATPEATETESEICACARVQRSVYNIHTESDEPSRWSLGKETNHDAIRSILSQTVYDVGCGRRRFNPAAEVFDGNSSTRSRGEYDSKRWQVGQPRESPMESAAVPHEAGAIGRGPVQSRDGGRPPISAFASARPALTHVSDQCPHSIFGTSTRRLGSSRLRTSRSLRRRPLSLRLRADVCQLGRRRPQEQRQRCRRGTRQVPGRIEERVSERVPR